MSRFYDSLCRLSSTFHLNRPNEYTESAALGLGLRKFQRQISK